MPLRPENVAPLIRKMKWRVVLADLFCLTALVLGIWSVSTPQLYMPAVIVLGIGLVMAILALVDR